MKKSIILLILIAVSYTAFSQNLLRALYYSPDYLELDESTTGVWENTYTEFITNSGFPDNGDLWAPDLELRVSALVCGRKIGFLFQRLDDELVNNFTYTNGLFTGSDSIIHRDATTLLLHFDTSSVVMDTIAVSGNDTTTDSRWKPRKIHENTFDEVLELTWVWSPDQNTYIVDGKLPNGSLLGGIDDIPLIQWQEGQYMYSKIILDIDEVAPWMHKLDTNKWFKPNSTDTIRAERLGIAIADYENDGSIDQDEVPYKLQTFSTLQKDMRQEKLDNVAGWNWWLYPERGGTYVSGIKNQKLNFARIYPNPASEWVIISPKSLDSYSYSIYDLSGRQLKNGTIHYEPETKINVADFETGMYFIRLSDSKKNSMTTQFLVTH